MIRHRQCSASPTSALAQVPRSLLGTWPPTAPDFRTCRLRFTRTIPFCSQPWLGITEPPGAFRRNYGKLRRFCVSFVITKKIITKKRSPSEKYSLWAREKLPLKPPVGAYSPSSLSSSSSSYSSSSLGSGSTRRTSGACSACLIMLSSTSLIIYFSGSSSPPDA
jgi:hypothetical protein